MKILEQLRTERTGVLRPDEFREGVLTADYGKTGEVKPYTLDANEEWYLTGTLRVKFWANKVQFDDALKIAEKVMIARLYGDILAELPELRLAINSGDRRDCFNVCDRIEAKLWG